MQVFTTWDIILIPLYVILLRLAINIYNKKHAGTPILAKYFSWGFSIKIFFCLFFVLFTKFISAGDTEMYYTSGLDFKKIVLENSENLKFITGPAKDFGEFYEQNQLNPANYGYVSASRNLAVTKFVALFSAFSFNSYTIISLFFCTISFFGLWGMFKIFYTLYPKSQREIFASFFLIPSVLFWGGGILKDTLCIGFLGIGFYAAYQFFFLKKHRVGYVLAFLVCFYLLYVIKSYIMFAFLPILVFWYFRMKLGLKGVLKYSLLLLPLLLLVVYLNIGALTETVSGNSAEALADNIESAQDNYKRATPEGGSLITYDISPSIGGIFKLIPQVLVTTLFRPFIWEADKATALIAAVEGTFFLGLTLYAFIRRGILNAFRTIFKNSAIMFCFLFSLTFATAIGLNCFNLGTLVRYKIPCIPFYVLSMLLVIKKQNETRKPVAVPVIKATVTA